MAADRLRLTHAARQDLRAARDWYQEHAPHVDERLRQSMRETLERIARQPTLYALVHQGVRRAPVPRFPYSIFYRVSGDTILVVAILHQARDPRVWRERTSTA
jgi:toxin ParE1/3/4